MDTHSSSTPLGEQSRETEDKSCSLDEIYSKQLLENERRLREAERLAKLGHWELEIESGKLHWSAETFRIFEVDPLEFEPSYEAFLKLLPPKDRDFVQREYEASVANKTQYNVYHQLRFPSGATKFVNERCRTFYDDSGKPLRSLGTILDMTGHNHEVKKLLKTQSALQIYASELEDEIEQLTRQLENEKAELLHAREMIETMKASSE